MQRSSPLTAMHAPALPYGSWGCRGEVHPPYSDYASNLGFGPSSFNFKDLSMERSPTDYFSFKPVRGSSPTASLAADLSTNFHIDQSPQLPTPRRSLFASNLFGAFNGRGKVDLSTDPLHHTERNTGTRRTPPVPSSSPNPGIDSMEISPLPHKLPFVVETQVEPTPMDTPAPEEEDEMDIMQDSPSDTMKQACPPHRRRHSLLRPSSRSKGVTTSAVTLKSARLECPPFRFGNGASVKSPAMVMTPEECFGASPVRDGRPQSADSPSAKPMGPPPRFRQSSSNLRSMAAPVQGHVRKPSNPMQRPRKQFRRSISMFEHPGDVMKQDDGHFAAARLDPVMDIDDPPRLQLPHFHSEDESLPRITKDTIIDVLDGKYNQNFERSLIVDCRFEYEYEGGHIDGAVNYNDKETLSDELLGTTVGGNTLLIFHCEYSACRAPLMAKHVRGRDRQCNSHRYPNLTYPEIYILDGGYSSFFANYKLRCIPQNYVEMGDKKYEFACERGMGRVKQQRTKLSRAQTFAFGQYEQNAHDSPTAPGLGSPSILHTMEIAIDSPLESRRLQSRRLASF